MFHEISPAILARMKELEAMDLHERETGVPRLQRLRQISPEVGRFLALLATSAPAGRWVEVGTSGAYSTLWLSLACRAAGQKLTTIELMEEKIRKAEQTIRTTGIGDVVELLPGDALEHLQSMTAISFCFLDAEKEIYEKCYELIVPRLVPGGWLVADNALSHASELQPWIDRVLGDRRVNALVVPIGSGELVCRKTVPASLSYPA